MNVAIIIARGGSKRVPRKNVRVIMGRPMIAWPITAALESGICDRVVVSTEDKEIADIALKYGAEVPFVRPDSLAGDFGSSCEVLSHALDFLAENGQPIDNCCYLYGTAYAVTPERLREGFELLQKPGTEVVMAVKEYVHPIERSLAIDENGLAYYRTPEFQPCRTQDLPVSYYDIGLFYWLKVAAFLKHGGESFLPLAKRVVVVPPLESVDIDTESDFATAEKLAQLMKKQS